MALAVLAAIFCWRDTPPQIITLPNGEQYQFVAAEWGTGQVQPTFTARMVDLLPTRLADFVVKKWGNRLGIVTPVGSGANFFLGGRPQQPSLHFWFRSTNDKAPVGPRNDFKFMLADKNGVIGGHGNGGWAMCGQGKNKWLTFSFPVLPRRSETLRLALFQFDSLSYGYGPFHQIATLQIPNPLFGHFPDWKPEPAPATKASGDLHVTLSDFTVAAKYPHGETTIVDGKKTLFHPPNSGEDQEIGFKLDIHSPRGTNEAWTIHAAELNDATGNRVRIGNLGGPWWDTGEYCFGPALWPDESAWQLALTLKKGRGYDPEEIVTFTNVPVPTVGASNTIFRTNSIHGVPVILKQEFTREPDRTPVVLHGLESTTTHVMVELLNHPKDFIVDYVALNADTGWKPTEWSNRNAPNSATLFLFSIPTNAHALNLTWVVQQTRTVKFLVKPPATK